MKFLLTAGNSLEGFIFRMTLAFIAVIFGLALLVWSADRFVEGSASTTHHFGMPPLLIGMVIVGYNGPVKLDERSFKFFGIGQGQSDP